MREGEGKLRGSSVPGRERGGSRRGPGGGGKRVNRESTCKQATRETNNVGAAGCSPNEAGRQAGKAGRQRGSEADRQAGRQACSLRRSLCVPFSVRASLSHGTACSTYRIARERARRESNDCYTVLVRGGDSKTRRNFGARRETASDLRNCSARVCNSTSPCLARLRRERARRRRHERKSERKRVRGGKVSEERNGVIDNTSRSTC